MSGDTMAGFISAFGAQVTNDTLWGSLTPLAGVFGTALLFALAFYIFRKLSKGMAKGKLKD